MRNQNKAEQVEEIYLCSLEQDKVGTLKLMNPATAFEIQESGIKVRIVPAWDGQEHISGICESWAIHIIACVSPLTVQLDQFLWLFYQNNNTLEQMNTIQYITSIAIKL